MLDFMFRNRDDAANRLAGGLAAYKNKNPLILAIPRGGVPIGRIVADTLSGELDVVLVRKLRAPQQPELAIGAIDEDGKVRINDAAALTGANTAYVRREAQHQLDVIRTRRNIYSPHRSGIDPSGRTVIVVDDGLATGATMASALAAVRAHAPTRLVCAVPVAAPASLSDVAALADEVVCLAAPQNFAAVGEFYRDFSAVEDDEVVRLLNPASASRGGSPERATMTVRLSAGVDLVGDLAIPANASAIVLFAHGSGSSRTSPRNRFVARELNRYGLATLLFDLLTVDEDSERSARFDIGLLSTRLADAVAWARHDERLGRLQLGLFGASTGAAAALDVAARQPDIVKAVVSRGGRPDLSGASLPRLAAPTLLIVGGADVHVLDLNRSAQRLMRCHCELAIIPGATHLFEEPGALEQVAELSATWFERWLV